MSDLRPIVDYRIGLVTTWAPVPVARENSDWPRQAAERLCDDEEQRELLARRLIAAHPDLIGPKEHVGVAVWAPDRAVGQIFGMLALDWIVPDGKSRLDRKYYLDLIERTERPKVTVLVREVTSPELPAGPAVRVHERISYPIGRRFSRREIVQENVMFTVFPPGSSDALKLTFSTDDLERGGDLLRDANTMAETLEVILGERDGS